MVCDRCEKLIENVNTTHVIDIDRGNGCSESPDHEWYLICQECFDYIIKDFRLKMGKP